MIALACDNSALTLKNEIKLMLDELGLKYKDYGTHTDERCNYTEYALLAANAVVSGECDRGILFCGTGIGMSIAANKVKGIRCALCSEPYSALMSREHNDANMLSLGARVTGTELAKSIVRAWLDGEFLGGRHAVRVSQIMEIQDNGTLN